MRLQHKSIPFQLIEIISHYLSVAADERAIRNHSSLLFPRLFYFRLPKVIKARIATRSFTIIGSEH